MRALPVMTVAAGLLAAVVGTSEAARPVVAVVGDNAGTEITDFVVPYGVLAASEAVEVVDVAVHAGPLQLMPPALTLAPSATIATFDARHPAGADYVIVPAVHHPSDADLVGWVRRQAEGGAVVVGICDGVWVLAAAGLLEGRAATGHWYSMASLAKHYPATRWVRDRRWVRDGPVMTTTGVTASLPAALALVEEIAGGARADALARELGVAHRDATHASDRFTLDRTHVTTAVANYGAFWRWEQVGVRVAAGVDEIGLAFTADALARTYRTSAVAVAAGTDPIATRRGLTILPTTAAASVDRVVAVAGGGAGPARALDATLATIAALYGPTTARFVALQLEYAWEAPGSP